jgi:hypothetical protein
MGNVLRGMLCMLLWSFFKVLFCGLTHLRGLVKEKVSGNDELLAANIDLM